MTLKRLAQCVEFITHFSAARLTSRDGVHFEPSTDHQEPRMHAHFPLHLFDLLLPLAVAVVILCAQCSDGRLNDGGWKQEVERIQNEVTAAMAQHG